MRSRTIVLACIAAGLWTVPPHAAQEFPAELAERILAAVGGREAWAEVEAIRLRGRRNRNGAEMGLLAWIQRPDRVRVEHTFRGDRRVFVFDGERGRLANFGGAEPVDLEPAQTREWLDELEKVLRWPELWERCVELEVVGTDDEGRARVTCTPQIGAEETWLIDAASGRVEEIVEPAVGEEGESYEVHSFGYDYREVSGLVFPFYVEIDHGTALYSFLVDEVEVGPELHDGLFELPGGG